MILLSNIIAIIGFGTEIFCFWNKKKKDIITFQILANTLYGLSYFVAGSLSGGFTNLINGLRSYLCNNQKNKYKIILLLALYIGVSIISYKDIFSLLPILSGIIFTYCIYQKNTMIIRIGSIISNLLWIIYNLHEELYILSLTALIILLSTLLSLIKLNLLKK